MVLGLIMIFILLLSWVWQSPRLDPDGAMKSTNRDLTATLIAPLTTLSLHSSPMRMGKGLGHHKHSRSRYEAHEACELSFNVGLPGVGGAGQLENSRADLPFGHAAGGTPALRQTRNRPPFLSP